MKAVSEDVFIVFGEVDDGDLGVCEERLEGGREMRTSWMLCIFEIRKNFHFVL